MFFAVILFLLGLGLIIKGGDLFVDAASWIAETTGIPKFIIGATIVSLATTLPELLVSVFAVLDGSTDLGIGNAIGSVSCNIGLIMAISILALPSRTKKKALLEKGLLMILSTGLLLFLSRDGILSRFESLFLFALLILYIILNIRDIQVNAANEKDLLIDRAKPSSVEVKKNIFMFLLGAIGIVIGAQLLVDNGTLLARMFGVSEAFIGLTLVALGTSLPELVTTLTSIIKKESDMSIGNIIGANIIDITMILSTCSFLSPTGLPVSAQTLRLDIPIALLLMLIVVIPPVMTGHFKRWQGFALLAMYSSYVVKMIL